MAQPTREQIIAAAKEDADYAFRVGIRYVTPGQVATLAAGVVELTKPDPKLRSKITAAILSVRVPVKGDALLYAADDGTMPLYSDSDPEFKLIVDAIERVLS